MKILVTGGTGFLGKNVVPRLQKIATVVDCISRSQPGCIRGDLTEWDGGMNPETLVGKYDVLLHMAGLYDLRESLTDGLKQNVTATHNALVIAQKAKIPHFVHISTVAVTVGERGLGSALEMKRTGTDPKHPLIHADTLDTSRKFPDHYGQTKAYGEHLVKSWVSDRLLSRLNLRLGILVGDTQDGKIERIDGPYHAAEFIRKSKKLIDKIPGSLPVPGDPEKTVPLVPVDIAAQAIVDLIRISRQLEWKGYKSLHLAPAQEKGLGAEALFVSALRHQGFADRKVSLIRGVPKSVLKYVAAWISGIPREELEYLLSFPRMETSETEMILGADWCPEFKSYETAFWKGFDEYVSNR